MRPLRCRPFGPVGSTGAGVSSRMRCCGSSYPFRRSTGSMRWKRSLLRCKPRSPSVLAFVLVGSTFAHPVIDFLADLALPQPPDTMRGQGSCVVDPAVDRVARDAQVFGDLLDGKPTVQLLPLPVTSTWAQSRFKSQMTQFISLDAMRASAKMTRARKFPGPCCVCRDD